MSTNRFDAKKDDCSVDALEKQQGTDGGASHPSSFCTFAVTGALASFQPIYVCHDCLNEESGEGGGLCICQACAEHCHGGDDHDVEYVGMGPCYCDCHRVGTCRIFPASQTEAKKLLGKQAGQLLNSEPPPLSNDEKAEGSPLYEVFEVPELRSGTLNAELVQQAQELIQNSKETFWLDTNIMQNVHDVCSLELLAWKIYQHHRHYYENIFPKDCDGGAEWWVQIKDAASNTGENGAIDLHYDKDEALAEVFGLGSFPVLSTVTYLTASDSLPFNPTLILERTYVQSEDDMIDSMLVSKPVLGKHLVFDGKLLHGAPSHKDLRSGLLVSQRQPSCNTQNNLFVSPDPECSVRVTFLVNIWNQKPAKVQQLPAYIRDLLFKAQSTSEPSSIKSDDVLILSKKGISVIGLDSQEDLPEHLQHRIELPFVSKGATVGDPLISRTEPNDLSNDDIEDTSDESDEDATLVVITFPPPPMTSDISDTMLIKFGPGLQAYLEYVDRQDSPASANQHSPYEAAYI